jgi:hypothetical protein
MRDNYFKPPPYDQEKHVCLRCENYPAIDNDGLCGHCHWAIVAEFEKGMREIADFLHPDNPVVRYTEACSRAGVTP